METAGHREPCESRGSCTVLGALEGESPSGNSTTARCASPRDTASGSGANEKSVADNAPSRFCGCSRFNRTFTASGVRRRAFSPLGQASWDCPLTLLVMPNKQPAERNIWPRCAGFGWRAEQKAAAKIRSGFPFRVSASAQPNNEYCFPTPALLKFRTSAPGRNNRRQATVPQ